MLSRGWKIVRALRTREMRAHLLRAINSYEAQAPATCPCCGYRGKFESFGLTARPGANCPRCESKERHRLLALSIEQGFLDFAGKSVLHFAPEEIVGRLVREAGASEVNTADLTPGRADRVLNIEAIELHAASVDRVICSHVLEHVDDGKALAELYRILRPGGYAVIMIPIVEGWEVTFEDASLDGESERQLYFGQWDHVRFYGSDFRRRVEAAGFALSEFTADGRASPQFGLSRGEKVFKAVKPGAA